MLVLYLMALLIAALCFAVLVLSRGPFAVHEDELGTHMFIDEAHVLLEKGGQMMFDQDSAGVPKDQDASLAELVGWALNSERFYGAAALVFGVSGILLERYSSLGDELSVYAAGGLGFIAGAVVCVWTWDRAKGSALREISRRRRMAALRNRSKEGV